MKSRIIGILCCSLIFLQSKSQDTLRKIAELPTSATSLSVDQFVNIFLVGKNNVEKYDKNGNFIARFESFQYGKIGVADVSNPMKIAVFFPDFLKVVFVDRFLAKIKEFDFFEAGYQNISAIGASTDGYLWFYDPSDLCIKKIDETGQIIKSSQPLNLILNETINPNFIAEKNGQVYVNDSAKGIFIFDIFLTYKKTLPIHGLKSFQHFQNKIVYFLDGKLVAYDLAFSEEETTKLPYTSAVSTVVIEKNRLFLLRENKLEIYNH